MLKLGKRTRGDFVTLIEIHAHLIKGISRKISKMWLFGFPDKAQ